MKAVILAGGLGTRISEESLIRPKPMIEIGGKPIIWHIMKMYASHGITDFIICAGYKGYMIKEYFSNYFLHQTDIEIKLKSNSCTFMNSQSEDWTVKIIDTGPSTQTGGRLKRVREYLDDEPFCFTYGDGVGDIDITATLEKFNSSNALALLTSYAPPNRFGILETEGDQVVNFSEKPKSSDSMINAGFFVLSPEVINLVENDSSVWEDYPLNQLAINGDLIYYEHRGFWQPMDTLRDKNLLESMWQNGEAAWKTWL
jgi:glucose-1-phosphate cytidylyltransferase